MKNFIIGFKQGLDENKSTGNADDLAQLITAIIIVIGAIALYFGV